MGWSRLLFTSEGIEGWPVRRSGARGIRTSFHHGKKPEGEKKLDAQGLRQNASLWQRWRGVARLGSKTLGFAEREGGQNGGAPTGSVGESPASPCAARPR